MLLVAVALYRQELRLALDVAMDVVNHFTAPGNGYPIRSSISDRFHKTLDALVTDASGSKEGDQEKPHLLIVAHSQGTVIVVDAFTRDLWRKGTKICPALMHRVSSMTILTFGSPLTHIYQHYFPEDYGSFSGTALSKLADDARVKWLNIYRADDFVGTIIAGPSDTFPRNVPMKEGGHFCYWEREVLGAPEICVHLPGANKC